MRRSKRLLIGAAIGAMLLMALVPVTAYSGDRTETSGNIQASIPNLFHRTCSRITRQCGAYREVNPPYLPGAGTIRYSTRCSCWIW